MWYYELNQQPFGPVSKETIADELKAGRITAQTRIWREGWAEWRHLGETELAALAGMTPPPEINTVTVPVYTTIPQHKKVNQSTLTKLFWWWFGLYLFVLPMLIISQITQDQSWVMGLTCAFEIPLLAGSVLQYVMLYKLWQIVQDGFARTTPGKAVGFSFIPFFGFYWIFVLYFGLSRNLKSYMERHFDSTQSGLVRKTHPVFSLCFVITSLIYGLVSMTIMVGSFSSVISNPSNSTAFSNAIKPYSIWITIFAMAQIGLMFITFFDYFLSAKSILKAEENKSQ
jgi:hypothetical protein